MSRLQAAVLPVLLAGTACRVHDSPSVLQAGERLLREGKPQAAIEMLAAVPWTAPDVMAARRLVAETCTRIDLTGAAATRPRVDLVEPVGTLPHDPTCFTEGFELDGDTLLESCGLYQGSSVRVLDLRSGAVLSERKLDKRYFAEGLTRFGPALFVLTWREGLALVFDSTLARQERSFPLRGEGWGLTHDATDLIASNGTNEIRFLDPDTGNVKRTLAVFNGELPLMNLNELEYVKGELLANIFPSERIARIDPASGELLGWILAEGLLPNPQRFKADILNGIAHDPKEDHILLTGKLWPSIFRVRLKPLAY